MRGAAVEAAGPVLDVFCESGRSCDGCCIFVEEVI
jgi:hypothetical protein